MRDATDGPDWELLMQAQVEISASLRAQGHPPNVVDEAVDRALLELCERWPAGGPAPSSDLLYVAARRNCLDDEGSMRSQRTSSGAELDLQPSADDLEARVLHRRALTAALRTVPTMRRRWRRALLMRAIGYSQEEIAADLSTSEKAVEDLLWRARRALRDRLGDAWGAVCAALLETRRRTRRAGAGVVTVTVVTVSMPFALHHHPPGRSHTAAPHVEAQALLPKHLDPGRNLAGAAAQAPWQRLQPGIVQRVASARAVMLSGSQHLAHVAAPPNDVVSTGIGVDRRHTGRSFVEELDWCVTHPSLSLDQLPCPN
jgi:RNA polymerase sigma-70 factor (ECF subfamily)